MARGEESPADVAVSRRGSAVVLTISRSEIGNRLSKGVLSTLEGQLTAAKVQEGVRAVVIAGSQGVFCLGGKIDGFATGDIEAEGEFGRAYARLARVLDEAPIPILTAVEGSCHAAGMSIVLASDLSIATEDATFGYPEAAAGLFPMLAMVAAVGALPRKVAFEMFYDGRLLSAEEALRLNLINEVVQPGDLWESVDGRVDRIARIPAVTVRSGRELYSSLSARHRDRDMAVARGMLLEMLGGAGSGGGAWR